LSDCELEAPDASSGFSESDPDCEIEIDIGIDIGFNDFTQFNTS